MALSDMHAPGAKNNPLDKSKLPNSRPELKVAVRSHSPRADKQLMRSMFAWMYFYGVWTAIALDLYFSTSGPIVFILGCALLSAYILFGISTAGQLTANFRTLRTFARYSVAAFLCNLGLVWLMDTFQLMGLLPVLTLLLLVVEAFRFRAHTLERACVGMLDEKTIRDFRRRKKLPKGLTPEPRLRAFLAAIRCYFTYNKKDADVPGVFVSPAGSFHSRVLSSIVATSLLSMTLYLFLGRLLLAMVDGEIGDTGLALQLLLFYGVGCPLVGIGVWLLVNFAFTWRFVGRALALKKKQISPSHWRRMLDRLSHSNDEIERDSIWMGSVLTDSSPILWPLPQLFQHLSINGKTGSRKTSWLMSLIDQLIYRFDHQVVFVDLKGFSHEVLSVMQRAARAREAKTKTPVLVKYFTLAEGEASYLLDIFSQAWWKRLAVPQRAGVILSTLGLRYSAAYGESWFRDVSYEFISVVLDRHPNVASWTDLWRKMVETRQNAPEHVISKMCREKGGEHIGIIVKRIASLAALNNEPHLPQSVRDNAIDFSSGHSYFSLCSLDNGLIAGEVGRLVAAAVLGSARALPSKRKKTVLVLDEWQEMITGDLEILLSQARSLGVAVILANQNAAQLVTKDKDMRPIVEGNCACQLFLGTLDIVGREQLQKLGGKEIDWLTTQQWPAQGEVRYSFVETVQDRVSNNLISEVASDESKFFVRLADNVGYACYGDLLFVGETMHHQTKKLYDDACEMPWPGLSAVTLQNANAVPRFRQNPRQAVSIAAQPRRNGNPVSQPTSP